MQLKLAFKSLYLLFFGYLAILPMSGTIALRNLFLLLIVTFIFGCYIFSLFGKDKNITPGFNVGQVPWVVFVWFSFLCMFPFFSSEGEDAFENLRGQWFTSMLAWVAGFGVVFLLGRRGPSILALGLASAFPLAVHLLLFVAAWGGYLSDGFYADPTIASIWNSIFSDSNEILSSVGGFGSFPVIFRGIEPMHGNLGYAACQAIALFGVGFYAAWRDKKNSAIFGIGVCIFLSFLSIFIASSRGAILFGFAELIIIFLVCFFKCRQSCAVNLVNRVKCFGVVRGVGSVFAVVLMLFVAFQVGKTDERWNSMLDKVQIGLLSEKPLALICNGISGQVEEKIRSTFSGRSSSYMQNLLDGLRGQDGARILLMRAGFDLVLENPWGSDGSRFSYQNLIREKCGHEPVLKFSHSHQGWIDLALALGWMGVLIFLLLLYYFLSFSWRSLHLMRDKSWALSLFMIAAFWIFRGFADSVYREHYLQMQALLLAYLYGRLCLELKGDGLFMLRKKGV